MAFKECRECSEKLCSPVLCDACLHNRNEIERLAAENERLESRLRFPSLGFRKAVDSSSDDGKTYVQPYWVNRQIAAKEAYDLEQLGNKSGEE